MAQGPAMGRIEAREEAIVGFSVSLNPGDCRAAALSLAADGPEMGILDQWWELVRLASTPF